MMQRRSALATLALSAIAIAPDSIPLHAAVLPAGFSEFAISGVISSGTAMEFAPDGKLFVLEQAGTIKVYSGSGATNWSLAALNFFSATPLSVNASGERGLLGIAFDPNYATNRFVYVYYTTASAPIHNRISRFTANAAGTLALAGSEAPLMDLDTLSSTIHNGGAIHFGADGKLYVAVGDNGSSNNAQSIATRLGKMLRLNPTPGDAIPADNPTSISGIAGTTMGDNRAIWAAGLRNPFTFTFRPNSSLMHINDVGAGTYEEVNVGQAGANYGWSTTEGPFNQAAFPNFRHPLIAYPRPGTTNPNFPAGLAYTGRAITGGAFYVPVTATFPIDYVGDYFFADFVDHWIRRYDAAGNTVQDFATGASNPVDLKVGSDGALYYLSRGLGRVFRVQSNMPAPCLADVVVNNAVDVNDLLAVITTWGPCANPNNCPADMAPVAGDDTVNVNDLQAVITTWGACP